MAQFYIKHEEILFEKSKFVEDLLLNDHSHLSNKREVTLTDFEKKNPPSTFIDFLDFFHPPVLGVWGMQFKRQLNLRLDVKFGLIIQINSWLKS